MTDAAVIAETSRSCALSPPCGWCVWRARRLLGIPNQPRARRFPRITREDTMSDETTPDPITRPGLRWHVHHAAHGEFTTSAKNRAAAIACAAASWDLPAGAHRVLTWQTDNGVPVSGAREDTAHVEVVRKVTLGSTIARRATRGGGE